ncbi:MAG: right-handed parallel beta-helix repeat-containing protein [Planctomycetota bacterium]
MAPPQPPLRPGSGPAPPEPVFVEPIAVAGETYWVDADAGDDANDGRTEATAFRSLQRATAALNKAGGDRLWLKGRFLETLTVAGLNPSAHPTRRTVVQVAFNAAGEPYEAIIDGGLTSPGDFPFDRQGLPAGFGSGEGGYLDRGVIISDCQYVTVSGLTIRGISGNGVLTWRSSHVRLEHLDVSWTSESALNLANGQVTDPMVSDLSIAYCRINQSNLGHWANEATGSGYSMRSETVTIVACNGFEVVGNHVSNSLMEGIDFKFGSRNGVIRGNLIENTRSAAIYVNEGDDAEIFHNDIRRIGWFDPQDGSGIKEAAPFLEQRLGIAVRADSSVGISIANGDLEPHRAFETGRSSGIRVYENVVSWTRDNGLVIWNEWRIRGEQGWLLDDIQIFNNVFHRSCQDELGNFAVQFDVGVTNCLIANNIVTEPGRPGMDIWESTAGAFSSSNTVLNNYFYLSPAGGFRGFDPLFGDPGIVALPAGLFDDGDYRLLPNSLAVDAGIEVSLPVRGSAGVDIGAFQLDVPEWSAGLLRKSP